MKNLQTKTLNRNQLRNIMAGSVFCPPDLVGSPCDDDSFSCLSLVPLSCVDGVWADCFPGQCT